MIEEHKEGENSVRTDTGKAESVLSDLLCTLGDSFRGLWTSVIIFDSHGGITKKKEWSVTYLVDNDYVETPGFSTPEEAFKFAITMKGRTIA